MLHIPNTPRFVVTFAVGSTPFVCPHPKSLCCSTSMTHKGFLTDCSSIQNTSSRKTNSHNETFCRWSKNWQHFTITVFFPHAIEKQWRSSPFHQKHAPYCIWSRRGSWLDFTLRLKNWTFITLNSQKWKNWHGIYEIQIKTTYTGLLPLFYKFTLTSFFSPISPLLSDILVGFTHFSLFSRMFKKIFSRYFS